jgi:SAM-dependent methyltransferase
MKNTIIRTLMRVVFRLREFNDRCVREFAADVHGKKILEVGSGKKYKGRDYYSVRQHFDDSNTFIQSDIFPEFGHRIVDVTAMTEADEFDVILCLNVLEHVFDFRPAFANLHRALRPGGTLVVFVPVFYPLHDEPHDYWRYTEHALCRLLSDFAEVTFRRRGLVRQFPFAYYIEATKA